MTLFFFDFDKTLYAYNFRLRLPALSLITGASQYHLAKTWWAGGFERRAEAGEWRTPEEYFEQFEKVTGVALNLDGYERSRARAITSIPGSIDALRFASTIGTVGVLSNNPSPFAPSLPRLAPDVSAIVGDNVVVSCELGVRKPDPEAYRLAVARFGEKPGDTFFADDSAENVAGASSAGLVAHRLTYVDGVPQVNAMRAALEVFVKEHS